MPFGPITRPPGVPSMLPERRIGRSSNPRLIASVNASSICDRERSGPRIRRFEMRRLRGPISVTVSFAAKLPCWESGRSTVSS